MKDYVLVPKEDISALKEPLKKLLGYFQDRGSVSMPEDVRAIMEPYYKLTETKYRTATDFAEPDAEMV